jgi:hypothetical protein
MSMIRTRGTTSGVRALLEDLSRSILTQRLLGTLSALFGALSLILVALG